MDIISRCFANLVFQNVIFVNQIRVSLVTNATKQELTVISA